jgi:hypothetical protein
MILLTPTLDVFFLNHNGFHDSKEEGPRNNNLSKRCRKFLWRKKRNGYILHRDCHGLQTNLRFV